MRSNFVNISLAWFIAALQWSALMAQNVVLPKGPVYTASEIPKILIAIDQDSLEQLYLEENWYENHEYPAIFEFETLAGTDLIGPVGFRFRGNTSRDKLKKSFKVSFNTFTPGGDYFGFEKLNLNAEVNDPSMLRSRFTWEMYRSLKIPAPRSNHVEVYVNDTYMGLYQNTEHIDEEFAENWFGNKKGNLYKCTYPANLQYVSENPDDYKMAPWGTRTYELKTNNELDDYSDLAGFISFLNLSSDAEFECGITDRFNVYNYLKLVAADVLTGNWDGYIYNQNNFYLYNNPLTGRFEYIPYDVDNTWGIDWLGQDWTDRSLYGWSPQWDDRPLYDRLMNVDGFRDIFSWHVETVLNDWYASPQWEQAAMNLQTFITEAALADPFRPLDFGFDDDAFTEALTEAAGEHVAYGIFEFAQLRRESALEEVETTSIAPIIWDVEPDFSDFPSSLAMKIYLEGPEAASAELNYGIDGVEQSPITLDVAENPMEVAVTIPAGATSIAYNVTATSVSGVFRNAFCEDKEILFNQTSASLVINEAMPSNASIVADESGAYEDWVELYNAGSIPINLEGFYLSDNDHAPKKWALPEIVLGPGGHILFWADGSIEEGPYHTNFNISASGETLYLFKEVEGGLVHIDQIFIPATPTDRSYGRELDGSLTWVEFASPTPNASNGSTLSTLNASQGVAQPYPNPTRDIVFIRESTSYSLFDLSGRLVMAGLGRAIDMSALSDGLYILEFGSNRYRVAKQD